MKTDEIAFFEHPQKGMANHPLLGIGLLRGIDIATYPGLARLNKSTANVTSGITFTVTSASSGVFTKNGHGLVAGQGIKLYTTGTLPTNLTAGTTYYVIATGLTANAFEVSATVGGSAIDTTSGAQAGTHTYVIVTALPYWIVENPQNGNLFGLDKDGQVYTSSNSGGTWTYLGGNTSPGANAGGLGLAIWKKYLFVARATALDVYGPLDSSPAWTNSWKTDLDPTNDFHTMLPSVDDKLYICCGQYIYKVAEASAPFAPGTGASYTATARAITLAQNYNAKCLADLGSNLMVGTWFGNSYVTNKVADIFPYSRSSLTLGIPIRLGENGVHAMITVGNRLYAIAGLNAKIFVTDGTSAVQQTEISNYAINILDTGLRLDVWPGAICYHRRKILFGVDNSSSVNGNVGVWSFNPTTKQLCLENIISTGSDGSSNEVAIGALFSVSNEQFVIGWKDFTSPVVSGFDVKGLAFIQSYGGIIEGVFPQVGEALANRTLQQVEFYLSKPLVSGQGVRVKYRKDLTSSFTTLLTVDFATNGAIQSFNISAASISNAIFAQLRIELTSTGNDSPELVRVIGKPSN